MNKPKYYIIGGYVRDELLGVKSNDIDYCVEANSYSDMKKDIIKRGGKIFLEQEQYFTIRAKLPQFGDADFVLCRKEGPYSDNRRPDYVKVGTLVDEQSRRDFVFNSIAKDEQGNLIDPFNGQQDIKDKIIRCVGNTSQRMNEDSLRMLRAIRFSITKDFKLDEPLYNYLKNPEHALKLENISVERIREELNKCFIFNTYQTLEVLNNFPHIKKFVFNKNIRLIPTIYERK